MVKAKEANQDEMAKWEEFFSFCILLISSPLFSSSLYMSPSISPPFPPSLLLVLTKYSSFPLKDEFALALVLLAFGA